MPKKKNKKNNFKSPLKSLSASQKAVIVLAIAIVIGPAYVAVSQLILESKFRSLESDIQEIKSSLDSGLGVKSEIKKECYRESFKYQKGPLKCAIRLVSVEVVDSKRILTVQEKIERNHFTKTNSGETFVEYSNYSTKQSCMLAISYGSVENKDKELKTFDLYCSEFSKRSFYPYNDH